jgi:glyoxylase I family protein
LPKLKGISHIELTVSDCHRAAAWWQDVMGFRQVNHVHGESFEVRNLFHEAGIVVSVLTHDAPLPGSFDERRIGLDHLAFEVADRDELQQWVPHLDARGVTHSGIIDIG